MSLRQQIYDVLPGKPFGRGSSDNNYTSDPNTRTYCTGTGTSLTLGSAILSNGDLCLIHQTFGAANATEDNWEVAIVASGGGSTSITLQDTLGRTYTTGAQVIKASECLNSTIGSAWAGHSYGAVGTGSNVAAGGINFLVVRKKLTINALINLNGYVGFSGPSNEGTGMSANTYSNWWYANATSGGFIGGAFYSQRGGNSHVGYDGTVSNSADWSGGGGARTDNNMSGGGGGNAAAGGNDRTDGTAAGGTLVGTASLTSAHLGGGGGGARALNLNVYTGSSGGGIWFIWADEIVFGASGGIQAISGSTTVTGVDRPGGQGAGGSIMINCRTAALDTAKVSAIPNTTVAAQSGIGSTGRIAIYHSGIITGTTTPTFTEITDTKLVESTGGAFLLNFV